MSHQDALRGLFVGRAAVLDRLTTQLDRVLGTSLPVLIEGEPGTGKTLLARMLHEAGAGRDRPLVQLEHPVEPGAVTRAACAGTGALLCEEVAIFSGSAQEELLDLLRAPPETPRPRRRPSRPGSRGPQSVQVLATTRLDLDAAVIAGWFSPELRDRFHVLRLRVPALREDPAAVAALFLQRVRRCSAPGEPPEVTASALDALRAHAWPGNVRELDLAARTLLGWAAPGRALDVDDVRRYLAQLGGPAPRRRRTERASLEAQDGPTLAGIERTAIVERLARHGWRQVETAKSLGIDRKTLYRKIRQYGIREDPTPTS